MSADDARSGCPSAVSVWRLNSRSIIISGTIEESELVKLYVK